MEWVRSEPCVVLAWQGGRFVSDATSAGAVQRGRSFPIRGAGSSCFKGCKHALDPICAVRHTPSTENRTEAQGGIGPTHPCPAFRVERRSDSLPPGRSCRLLGHDAREHELRQLADLFRSWHGIEVGRWQSWLGGGAALETKGPGT